MQYGRCAVEGCNNKYYTKGYCRMHYRQLVSSNRKCKIEGCENKYYVGGYCSTHYNKIKTEHSRICSVDGCSNKHCAFGYCSKHYAQFRRHGRIKLENSFNRQAAKSGLKN